MNEKQHLESQGLFKTIVFLTVINSDFVTDFPALYEFIYDINLTLRENFYDILDQLKMPDFFKSKPIHVFSI